MYLPGEQADDAELTVGRVMACAVSCVAMLTTVTCASASGAAFALDRAFERERVLRAAPARA